MSLVISYLHNYIANYSCTFPCYYLDSLKPFTADIHGAVDVTAILPYMVQNGLLTSNQHQYFLNPYHTSDEKQRELACIVVTSSEDCVEKFLQCLLETSDYEPHEKLLKKIHNSNMTA